MCWPKGASTSPREFWSDCVDSFILCIKVHSHIVAPLLLNPSAWMYRKLSFTEKQNVVELSEISLIRHRNFFFLRPPFDAPRTITNSITRTFEIAFI